VLCRCITSFCGMVVMLISVAFVLVQIPREILLEILGPSKVYKQTIKNVINSTVAEYVQKVDV